MGMRSECMSRARTHHVWWLIMPWAKEHVTSQTMLSTLYWMEERGTKISSKQFRKNWNKWIEASGRIIWEVETHMGTFLKGTHATAELYFIVFHRQKEEPIYCDGKQLLTRGSRTKSRTIMKLITTLRCSTAIWEQFSKAASCSAYWFYICHESPLLLVQVRDLSVDKST
jgi:hypothetical protein